MNDHVGIDLEYIRGRIEDLGSHDMIYTNSHGDMVCQYNQLRRENPDLDIDRIVALYDDCYGSWPAIGRQYGEWLARTKPWECVELPDALYGCMKDECRDQYYFPAEDLVAWGGSPGYPSGFYCIPAECIKHAKEDFEQCYMQGWKPGVYGWRPRLDEWTPDNVLPSDEELAARASDVEQAIHDNTGPNLAVRMEHSRRVLRGEEQRAGKAWEYAGNIMGPLYSCQYGDCSAYKSVMASFLVWFGTYSPDKWNGGYAAGWYCPDHLAATSRKLRQAIDEYNRLSGNTIDPDLDAFIGPTLQEESVRRKDMVWNSVRV